MAKQIISASTDTTGGLGYFLTKLWAKIKELFYTKTETDGKLSGKADAADLANYLPLSGGTVSGNLATSNPNADVGFTARHTGWGWNNQYIKFMRIKTTQTSRNQDMLVDIEYSSRGSMGGHLFVRMSQAESLANLTCELYNKMDWCDSFSNPYHIVKEADGSFLLYAEIKNQVYTFKVAQKGNNAAAQKATIEFLSERESALPTGAVQATMISFGGKTGGIGGASAPIYINANAEPTACSAYAGGTAVTLNGTSKGASTASFFAPTTAGTAGYLLQSNGSGAPTWKSNTRTAAAVSADTTPTDASVTMYQGTATCTLTLTDTLANAIGVGNDIVCLVKGATAYKLTVRYHLGVSESSYGSVVVQAGQCVRLVAVGGAWCLQV